MNSEEKIFTNQNFFFVKSNPKQTAEKKKLKNERI